MFYLRACIATYSFLSIIAIGANCDDPTKILFFSDPLKHRGQLVAFVNEENKILGEGQFLGRLVRGYPAFDLLFFYHNQLDKIVSFETEAVAVSLNAKDMEAQSIPAINVVLSQRQITRDCLSLATEACLELVEMLRGENLPAGLRTLIADDELRLELYRANPAVNNEDGTNDEQIAAVNQKAREHGFKISRVDSESFTRNLKDGGVGIVGEFSVGEFSEGAHTTVALTAFSTKEGLSLLIWDSAELGDVMGLKVVKVSELGSPMFFNFDILEEK